MITIEEFAKVELKVGKVLESSEVEGSNKLIKLVVDLGEEQPRIILSGIKLWYKAEDLVGRQVVVASNLQSRQMMGLESQGMILAASDEELGPVLLTVSKEVKPGSKVR